MKAANSISVAKASPSNAALIFAVVTLALATLAAYANSFSGPFVYDDVPAIPQNETIRHFSSALQPPPGLTVSGRPLLNLSLALNYAISGSAVWSYHVVNVLIHLLAGLALFGLVRRTLLAGKFRESIRRASLTLALAVASWWTLHPLQTEAVDYLVQRTEAMMGLWYLLTLYSFIRSTESKRPINWLVVSVATCAFGMASKEVMVSAPLIVLLYDRTFVAGTFSAAWRQRWRYYVALAATWSVLVFLLVSTGGNRNGTKGFGTGVSWWAYDLTQFKAVAHYLLLALWPHPLAFDYASYWVTGFVDVAPFALLVLPLLVGTVVALWRRPVAGFLGAWFFVMLAPSSLVPGPSQMIVEHRMYLSLAAVVAPAVIGLHLWLGRRSVIVFVAVAVALGGRTIMRNEDYRSELALWGKTVAVQPTDAIAQCNFAIALVQDGRIPAAIAHYETALQLAPNYPAAHYNLGVVLAKLGRRSAAISEYERTLQVRPDFTKARANLGLLYFQSGRLAEAVQEYETALQQAPGDAEIHGNLGNALAQLGRISAAVIHYRKALEIEPGNADIHYNFGNTLFQNGRVPEAIEQYQRALRLRPEDADTHFNLGLAFEESGKMTEAGNEYERALQLRPNSPEVRQALIRLWGGR